MVTYVDKGGGSVGMLTVDLEKKFRASFLLRGLKFSCHKIRIKNFLRSVFNFFYIYLNDLVNVLTSKLIDWSRSENCLLYGH